MCGISTLYLHVQILLPLLPSARFFLFLYTHHTKLRFISSHGKALQFGIFINLRPLLTDLPAKLWLASHLCQFRTKFTLSLAVDFEMTLLMHSQLHFIHYRLRHWELCWIGKPRQSVWVLMIICVFILHLEKIRYQSQRKSMQALCCNNLSPNLRASVWSYLFFLMEKMMKPFDSIRNADCLHRYVG